MKQTQIGYHLHPAAGNSASVPQHLTSLPLVQTDPLIRLRDGEVVLYKRPGCPQWQVRFKLFNRKWHRQSTKHTNLEYACRAACDAYDEARFKERLGLPITTRRFGDVAKHILGELRRDLAAGTGKSIFKDYLIVLEKYLIPFFGKMVLTRIDYDTILTFEQWRNETMGRVPKASTLLNHAAAYNRVFDLAQRRGWVSSNHAIPRLSTKGERSKPRPAFSRDEVNQLLTYMADWSLGGKAGKIHDMRVLLRDYVEMLLYTGMRHGTEAMNIQWKHLEWHTTKDGKRYLRIWVSGKTGPRWLIARHEVIPVLDRIRARHTEFSERDLDCAIAKRSTDWLFALPDGTRPYNLVGTFRRLMRTCGMEKDASGKLNRTLYSLRHTYATLALIEDSMDIHTLAKQMGTSIQMIEQHYSKLTPTLNAAKLAGQHNP